MQRCERLREFERLRYPLKPIGRVTTLGCETNSHTYRCEGVKKTPEPPLRLCVNFLLRPVPVPLAAALLVFPLLGLLAFQSTRKPAAPQSVVVHVPVTVPVVQEKLVTRVVYRNRYVPSRTSKRTGADSRAENTFAKSQMPRPDDVPTLAGFKPAADVKLTVIKGGSPNER